MQVANPHLVARYQQILQSSPRRIGRTASSFEESPHLSPKHTRSAAKELFQGEDRVTISEQAKEMMRELAARDRQVQAHETAHTAAGGRHAGPPTYEMEKGPDGRSYAVGGEASISTSPAADNPQETLKEARQIRAADRASAEIRQEQSVERQEISPPLHADDVQAPGSGRRRATGRILNLRA